MNYYMNNEEYARQLEDNSGNSEYELSLRGYKTFMGDVTQDSVKPLIDWIIAENFNKTIKHKELTLAICSPGGDLNACFALVDIMKGSKIPIRTIGMGLIASCGLVMFISGEKGRRILTPNTSILSHQYSWGSYGKEHELFAQVKEYDLTTTRMINHYRKCTGLSEKQIREYLLPPHDVWLSAKEAKKLGLCDSIKETY
ncbi:MAG: ATP-dependent Clp protease proteolytic subunit [Candidatus Marinimicrobia bacterium]|nr:ATP-dependent Clp protease proteolytic subunit [Candidatus Neomarinimicrobiota bacterium]